MSALTDLQGETTSTVAEMNQAAVTIGALKAEVIRLQAIVDNPPDTDAPLIAIQQQLAAARGILDAA